MPVLQTVQRGRVSKKHLKPVEVLVREHERLKNAIRNVLVGAEEGEGMSRCEFIRRSYFSRLLVALAMLLFAVPANSEESVRLGFLNAARHEMNSTDVRAAFELWSRELGVDFKVPIQVSYYDDIALMREDFLQGKINAVTADAMTLATHFKLDELTEGYSVAMPGGVNLLLLTGTDAPVNDLAGLAGKRIVMIEGDTISEIYLESICLRHYQRPCSRVFGEIQRVSSSNQAVMRLFFAKADLALVNRYGYELAGELNPQIVRKAGRVLAEFPITSLNYAFFSINVDKAVRSHALYAIPRMHLYPRGRQILDIFKMDHLELADPAELKPFITLDQDYRELREKYMINVVKK